MRCPSRSPSVLLVPLLASLAPCAAGEPPPRQPAAEPPRVEVGRTAAFVNHTVSSRSIALNEPLRIEFTTMARQLPEVDIAASVRAAIDVGGASTWVLIDQPLVVENEKSRTVSVTIALQPRMAGSLDLPQIPLTWLKGNALAAFGKVEVAESISVAGQQRPLPAEVQGVARVPWGGGFAEWRDRVPGAVAGLKDGAETLTTPQGLELRFMAGRLAEATMLARGLTMETAQRSFAERWGVPRGTPRQQTWLIGWTRITATPAESGGVILRFADDKQIARIAQVRFDAEVVSVLTGNDPLPQPKDMAAEFGKLKTAATAAPPR